MIGILLGNASLQTFNNGITYRLRVLQKNQEYCKHLYNIFQNFVTTPPKSITTKREKHDGILILQQIRVLGFMDTNFTVKIVKKKSLKKTKVDS